MEAQIVKCSHCGTKNRVPEHSNRVVPRCGKCGSVIRADSRIIEASYGKSGSMFERCSRLVTILFIFFVWFGIYETPKFLSKDYTPLVQDQEKKTRSLEDEYARRLQSHRDKLNAELNAVNPEALRANAARNYKAEFRGRESYDQRYALTDREKALLQMKSLASNSTKTYHEILKSVAQQAAPSGSDVTVEESPRGLSLHVDFDMSSMTSGEQGTRTKHHTKDSLKKEVVSLSSRVVNDIFEFCKSDALKAIHVGCRHHVEITDGLGNRTTENVVLYAISVKNNDLLTLQDNPFLDDYSSKEHFRIEEDNFQDIYISTSQI